MFPCDGYLQLAKELATKEDEASQRSAVSRAYYAVYHKCRIYAEDTGFQSSFGKDTHKEVANFFINSGGNLIPIGNKLKKLKKERKKCDYDNYVKCINDVLENSFTYAEEIFNSFSSTTV